jgi:hypothetical protein
MALLLIIAPLLSATVACKSKEEKAAAPTEATTTSAAEGEATEAPIAPKAPVTAPTRELASEEDQALVKGFIVEFTKIMEAAKSDGFLELYSKARRARLIEKDAVEQAYGAWVKGSVPVLEAIRSAEFRLEKIANDRLLLTLIGIEVPNDPGAAYEMHMVVEDGALRIDEN